MFKNICQVFFLIFISFNLILSKEPTEYTQSLLYDTIIGTESPTEVSLILNTYNTDNLLFTNIYRAYSKEINRLRNDTELKDTINLGKKTVKNLTFTLTLDKTQLDNYEIQGELGLGIDEDLKNELMEHLYDIDLIRKRQIILETNNDPENVNIIVDPEVLPDNYFFCNLTHRADLDERRQKAWICEMSHLIGGLVDSSFTWSNAEEINARIVFDSRSKYIYIPEGYLNLILDYWNLNLTLCPISENTEKNEKFINCTYLTEEQLHSLKPIYFVMDGYACLFLASDLFEKVGYNQYFSIVRFNKEDHDIWTLGVPFFKKYKVLFDYDKQRVGFSGVQSFILDYSEDYTKWLKERNAMLNKKSNDKKIMIIGAFMGIAMLLTMIYFLLRSIIKEKHRMRSQFIEEIDRGKV